MQNWHTVSGCDAALDPAVCQTAVMGHCSRGSIWQYALLIELSMECALFIRREQCVRGVSDADSSFLSS